MEILIKRLNENAKLPMYSSEAGSGIQLSALEGLSLEPGARARVSTGIIMAIPVGYVGLIWSQNGISIEDPIKVTTWIIDSGYRSEIVIELTNTGSEMKMIEAGETVAQLLVQQVHHAHLIEAEDVSSSR